MEHNKISRHLIISLFVLFLLFSPSFQKVILAQDGVVGPTGLGQAPQNGRDLGTSQSLKTRSKKGVNLKFFTYLPLAVDPSKPVQTANCGTNTQERSLAALAKSHPSQERPAMNCHAILSQVAHERALDMGRNEYFSHINLDGYGPNYLVAQAGYNLPSWWPDSPTENYIESIAAGYTSAEEAWNAWLNSKNHRVHVLGENDFWAEQTNYGMGYAYVEGSPYGHYWVFISAPPQAGQ